MRVIGVWWLTCLLWSSTYLFIKLGLAEIPPLSFAWLRLLLALSVLIPLTVRQGRFTGISSREVAPVFCAGLLSGPAPPPSPDPSRCLAARRASRSGMCGSRERARACIRPW
jgi:drug/metabolite transporter (DMT)-like permease